MRRIAAKAHFRRGPRGVGAGNGAADRGGQYTVIHFPPGRSARSALNSASLRSVRSVRPSSRDQTPPARGDRLICFQVRAPDFRLVQGRDPERELLCFKPSACEDVTES